MNQQTTKEQNQNKRNEAYNNFIRQIKIDAIKVLKARIENLDCSYFPEKSGVNWIMDASYENKEGVIEVRNRYRTRIVDKNEELKARVSVTFCVEYLSKTPMNDELFETFQSQNLMLNTWPYFREFIHNAVQRMGWPPFIAPLYIP